ncbi:MAG: phosphatidylserine decarboxylase [Bdellovibrio sp.]|nr:phosphatidylserine decarboxylase [Bdellovibrio sp.]
MKLITRLNKYFAQFFWNLLPATIQKTVSFIWSIVYKTKFSKVFIGPFAVRYRISAEEMKKFSPASGKNEYQSFQDFFTRRLRKVFQPLHESISPCEGLVCETGIISELKLVNVKGRNFSVRNIFGRIGNQIPGSHFFINIFLHNHNYHRFHSPVQGVIKSIQKIPGQLNFLRPWLYLNRQVSEPAFVNERLVVEIESANQERWFLSFVGGMGVGQIKIYEHLTPGALLQCGEEMGLFLLGSTCCLAVPRKKSEYKFLSKINLGDSL